MAFRDDTEAMRARIRALESELEAARQVAASRAEEEAMRARIGVLEAELRAVRDEAAKARDASENRNRELQRELEETRQALARAEWRARGLGEADDEDGCR